MEKQEYLTLSNLLSFLRIFFVIPIFYYLSINDNNTALIYIGVAALTDWLDGFLARKLNQITTLGKIIDPVADKICTGGVFIALYIYQEFPLWLTLIILFRDILILFGSTFLFGRKRLVAPSNISGKLTVLAITFLGIGYILKLELLILPLMILTIIMIAYSGINYFMIFYKGYFIKTNV